MTGDKDHKPGANLGPVSKGPFFAVPLRRMGATGIPAAGLEIDQNANVVGWNEQPIAGLYAAGNSVARLETGAVMQSGVSNARGMTYGWRRGFCHRPGHPGEWRPDHRVNTETLIAGANLA